mmetsp:Transcript_73278/g.202207  ORF Transcript_73278/g.202207 Transcript_73278/m.202207 type:complete len:218 (+) Transcript_73278:97-750(+)
MLSSISVIKVTQPRVFGSCILSGLWDDGEGPHSVAPHALEAEVGRRLLAVELVSFHVQSAALEVDLSVPLLQPACFAVAADDQVASDANVSDPALGTVVGVHDLPITVKPVHSAARNRRQGTGRPGHLPRKIVVQIEDAALLRGTNRAAATAATAAPSQRAAAGVALIQGDICVLQGGRPRRELADLPMHKLLDLHLLILDLLALLLHHFLRLRDLL